MGFEGIDADAHLFCRLVVFFVMEVDEAKGLIALCGQFGEEAQEGAGGGFGIGAVVRLGDGGRVAGIFFPEACMNIIPDQAIQASVSKGGMQPGFYGMADLCVRLPVPDISEQLLNLVFGFIGVFQQEKGLHVQGLVVEPEHFFKGGGVAGPEVLQ